MPTLPLLLFRFSLPYLLGDLVQDLVDVIGEVREEKVKEL
jgi:hypothetical protein